MTNTLDQIPKILKQGNQKTFYKIKNESISYKECYEKVLELSNNLKKQGTKPVITYGHKSINQLISILACLSAHRCYIPVDFETPKERIKEIIKKSKAELIIKNENIDLNDIECLTIKEINEKYKNNKELEIKNKYAYIIFTSGSTGTSKGVPISYDNLENFINWINKLKEFENCSNLNILSQAIFSFDLSVMDIYFSIYKKSTIIGIDKETKSNLNETLKTIKKEKINFLIMTPTFIKLLLLDKNFNEKNYNNIKYMFFCGECLEIETVKKIKERFKKISIINAYGPTEATCFVTLTEITDDMLNDKYLPVGKISTKATNIEIIKNEIVLSGKSVFDKYLDIKSDNVYKKNKTNFYKTKDKGYIKNDYLYCTGRLDNQIKYQGYRIELEDIENNLLKIAEIKEAVVICKYKENSNIVKLIKAFVTLNKKTNETEIKEKLKKLIPSYMIPKQIIIIDKIPVNNNGKYDRKKLSLW